MPVIVMALNEVISNAVLIEQRNDCFVKGMWDLPCHTEALYAVPGITTSALEENNAEHESIKTPNG